MARRRELAVARGIVRSGCDGGDPRLLGWGQARRRELIQQQSPFFLRALDWLQSSRAVDLRIAREAAQYTIDPADLPMNIGSRPC